MTTPHADDDSDDSDVEGDLPLLYNMVYCSKVAAGVDESAVARIIETARRYNPKHEITGLLVFGGDIFFQWLEGPRADVTALMASIRKDPRHSTVVPLSESEESRERLFPQWDMEWVTCDAIRDVLDDALTSATDEHHRHTLRSLLAHLDTGELSPLAARAG